MTESTTTAVDPLEIAIASMEAEAAAHEREAELIRREIRGMRRAAELLPVRMNGTARILSSVSPESAEPFVAKARIGAGRISGPRGKVKGTISQRWRDIMGKVVAEGNQALTPELWTVAASELGHALDPKAVRDWLRRGVGMKMGFIERHGDAYRVTDAAITKFGLKTAEPPPEGSSDGSV